MSLRKLLALVAAAVVAAGCTPDDGDPSNDATPGSSPAYSLVDVSVDVGVEMEHRRSWGGTWVDYDDDGDPDLLANRHFFVPFFYDNDDGSYVESPLQADLGVTKMDRHACLWGDPNADGLPDVLCTQGAQRGKGLGSNQLLVQDDDGTFTERAAEIGVDYPPARSRTINWVDYDNDGDLDLFVGAELREDYPNQMLRNDDGRFVEADVGLDDELKVESTAWGDWDNDGDLDVIITIKKGNAVAYENHDGRFERTEIPRITDNDWLGATFGAYNSDRWPDLHLINETRSLVLVNRRGSFEPVHRMPTEEGRTGIWFDVDNDADQDLFVIRGAPGEGDDPDAEDAPDVLLIRDDDGFRERDVAASGVPTGNGDSVAVADHDRDGDLDLFVTNGYKRSAGPFIVLENRSRVGNWVALDLDGGPGDPLAMWAELKVTTDDGTYWTRITDGFVFRSQSEVGYAHLGIGDAERAEIEVRWRDGTRDCVAVAAGDRTDLSAGASPC